MNSVETEMLAIYRRIAKRRNQSLNIMMSTRVFEVAHHITDEAGGRQPQ